MYDISSTYIVQPVSGPQFAQSIIIPSLLNTSTARDALRLAFPTKSNSKGARTMTGDRVGLFHTFPVIQGIMSAVST